MMREEVAGPSLETLRYSVFLFRQTFRDAGSISRRHFLPFFLVMLCGAAPNLFLPPLDGPEIYGIPTPATNTGTYLLTQAGITLASALASLVVIFASLQHLCGSRVDYRAAFRLSTNRVLIVWVALLIVFLFTGLAIFAVTMAISFLGQNLLGAKTAVNWLIGLWIVLSIGALCVSLAVFTPVVAIERRGFWLSFRQAFFLTRGYRWKILLIILAVGLTYSVVSIALTLVVRFSPIETVVPQGITPYTETVDTAFFSYVMTILEAVLYYRLRQIKGDPLVPAELI